MPERAVSIGSAALLFLLSLLLALGLLVLLLLGLRLLLRLLPGAAAEFADPAAEFAVTLGLLVLGVLLGLCWGCCCCWC